MCMQLSSCKEYCTVLLNAQLMTGNRQGSGSQMAEMQYLHSRSNRGSTSKGFSYHKVSRTAFTEERSTPRQGSRASSFTSSSANRSAVCSKSFQSVGKAKTHSLSNSPTNEKFQHVPALPKCRNVMNCFGGSSDDSGSEAEVEIGMGMNGGYLIPDDTGLHRSRQVPCQGNISASSSSCIPPFLSEASMREQSTGVLARRPGAKSFASCDQTALGGKQVSDSMVNVSNGSSTAIPLNSSQCVGSSTSSRNGVQKKRFGLEFVCNYDVEKYVGESSQGRHGNADAASEQLSEFTSGMQNSRCKGRTGAEGVLGHRSKSVSHGFGYRMSNVDGSGLTTSFAKHNTNNLNDRSSTDVPKSASSSAVGTSDQSIGQRTDRLNSMSNRNETLRGLRSGKSPMPSPPVGCVAHRNASGSLSERGISKGDSLPAWSSRRLTPAFQTDTWCTRKLPSGESDLTTLSNTSMGAGSQLPLPSRGSVGGNPLTSRGRSVSRSTSRSSEHPSGMAATFGERPSQRLAGSNSRVSSPGVPYANQFGVMGVESRNSVRGKADTASSSSAASSFIPNHHKLPNSVFSGPPPSRPPPAPGFGLNQQHTRSIQSSEFPSFLDNPFSLPQTVSSDRSHLYANMPSHFSRLISAPEDDYDRHETSDTETLLFVPSREPQLHSVGDSEHLIAEGLSEILTALGHVDQNEELSYEQILMLEATILLGGMGLHDQFRDMRLDVDNMSYEELLALEERIGNVSTGLSEEAIAKCLKRSQYTSFNISKNYVPQDIEIKCSVCQEEFEENIELGILKCGHSHHLTCIKQWLLQKNLCPICKAAAF
eukprot:c28966_g1_i1 orf=1228-3687(+)